MTRFVVVGAGPAGLSLAYLLAKQGHPVALVDASNNFSRQFRGDALMPCGLEALSHMGLSNLVAELPQRDEQDDQPAKSDSGNNGNTGGLSLEGLPDA